MPNQIVPTKLVSECLVKPKSDEIIYEITKQPYFLNPLDLLMLFKYPIQKGLLFTTLKDTTNSNDTTTTTSETVSHLFEKLKHSLSHALVHFYPLAGRLTTQKYPEENACTISVDCTEGGLGARLIRAAALGLTVSDIIRSPNDVSTFDISSFFDLGEKWNNYDGHTRALLSIQVTELVDGVFIGFSMNHCVGDGTTFIHFINMLSEIYNFDGDLSSVNEVIKISRPPIFNYKPWNVNKLDNEDVPVIKFPDLDFDQYLEKDSCEPERLSQKIFHFSSTSMSKLKAEANQQCGTTHNNVISSFQALTALVWRSITKARNLPSGQPTVCIITANARPRLNPPLSDDYVGNFISGVYGACKVDEILGQDLGWAAMILNKSITAHKEEQILDFFKSVVDAPKVMAPSKGVDPLNKVTIGGSARFDMYGPQFGLGRALAARVSFGPYESGKVNANPGCEGGGSIDLEICLKPETMAALEVNEEFMSFVTTI